MMVLSSVIQIRFRFLTPYLFFGVMVLAVLAQAKPAHAEPATDQLDCDPPKYAGIVHCTQDAGKTHILKIDLTDSGVRFETVLAGYRTQSGEVVECQDVNLPHWSTGEGCVDPATGLYPDQPITDIVARYPGAVAAINADYFADDRTHGPEGFTVKNGTRFDGWPVGDCDSRPKDANGRCYGNDVNRSSLAISRSNQVEIGKKRKDELDNPSSYTDRFYNAVGGGPLIVRDGRVIPDAQACAAENLSTGVCTRTAQTAAGLTRNGRTLILVVSGTRSAEEVGQVLVDHSVWVGMKLDGGGSSQMWYDGQPFYATGERRELAELLVAFSVPLPDFDAAPIRRSDFFVADPGAQVSLSFEIRNAGARTWEPGQNIYLENVNSRSMGANARQPLTSRVLAGEIARWAFSVTAPKDPGVHPTQWQVKHAGAALGPVVTAYVIVIPSQAKDLRNRIERLIEEWRQRAEQEVETLLEQIAREIADAAKGEIERRIDEVCGGAASLLLLVGIWLVRHKRV